MICSTTGALDLIGAVLTRPGFTGGSNFWVGWNTKNKTANRHSPEVRWRAVRMVLDNQSQHDSRWSAVLSISAKIGCALQTLNAWVKKAEIHSGERAGVTTEMADRLRALEPESRSSNKQTRSCAKRPRVLLWRSSTTDRSHTRLHPLPDRQLRSICREGKITVENSGASPSAGICRLPHPSMTIIWPSAMANCVPTYSALWWPVAKSMACGKFGARCAGKGPTWPDAPSRG